MKGGRPGMAATAAQSLKFTTWTHATRDRACARARRLGGRRSRDGSGRLRVPIFSHTVTMFAKWTLATHACAARRRLGTGALDQAFEVLGEHRNAFPLEGSDLPIEPVSTALAKRLSK